MPYLIYGLEHDHSMVLDLENFFLESCDDQSRFLILMYFHWVLFKLYFGCILVVFYCILIVCWLHFPELWEFDFRFRSYKILFVTTIRNFMDTSSFFKCLSFCDFFKGTTRNSLKLYCILRNSLECREFDFRIRSFNVLLVTTIQIFLNTASRN